MDEWSNRRELRAPGANAPRNKAVLRQQGMRGLRAARTWRSGGPVHEQAALCTLC
jgi:hypothetical protein